MVRRKGRKTQRRSEETRSLILNSALALFREQGFERTTMREIAERAELAVGATYYYFARKEELVFEQYLRMQEESEADAREAVQQSKKLEKRLKHVVEFKFEQLGRDRDLIRTLGRIAADPTSELSPFSVTSAPIRQKAILMMADLCQGSDLKVANALRPKVPFLLWLFYLAIIFLWAHDPSAEQRLTRSFAALALPLLLRLLQATTLPLTGGITTTVEKLLAVLEQFCGEVHDPVPAKEN
jgi:AcrR family transcriptional regulator